MTRERIRLGVTTCDAIVVRGQIQIISKVTEAFVEHRPLRGDGDPISLSHMELSELIDQGHYSIQYGYFSSRQVARRAMAGRGLMSRLPVKTQRDAFWKECWCTSILALEGEGKFNRSAARWEEFLPALEQRTTEMLKLGLNKSKAGRSFDSVEARRTPSRTSIMSWLRKWETSKDPMVLVKKSIFNGQRAKRIGSEQEAILQGCLEAYLHPNRVHAGQIHDAVNAEIRHRNSIRKLTGEVPLNEVSKSTTERRINELDMFEVIAAREGVAVAKHKLGAHGGGLQIEVPFQRIEMDEWEIDLMAILNKGGVDITTTNFRDIEIGRYWVCVAFDTASRSIVGLKLSKSPTAEDAKAVLWMAMRNKTELARQIGCETDWKQHGHICHVVVDNGPAFVNVAFKAALADLCVDYSVLPAGIPKLRARIERLFSSVATLLMPHLTGRTFSNPNSRGDYPSQKYAVHTAESILELLVRFTVDVYHNRKHRGLEYASPNIVWDRLLRKFCWSPPMNNHVLRHILGLAFTRDTGRHGIRMNGVNYHSDRLAKHFQKFGKQRVDVRLDPENIGHISVWLDDGAQSGWSSVRAQMEGLEGVAFATWEHAIFDLRQNNRNLVSLQQDVIDRAIKRIKEIDAKQCALRQLGPIGDTYDQIRRSQKETFWGLSLGGDPEPDVSTSEASDVGTHGLLSNEIGYAPAQSYVDSPVFSREPDHPIEFWTFSDENVDEVHHDAVSKNMDDEND